MNMRSSVSAALNHSRAKDALGLIAANGGVAAVGLILTLLLQPAQKGLFTTAYTWANAVYLIGGMSLPYAILHLDSTINPYPSRRLTRLIGMQLVGFGVLAALLTVGRQKSGAVLIVLAACLPLVMQTYDVLTFSIMRERGPFIFLRVFQVGIFGVGAIASALIMRSAVGVTSALLLSYVVAIPVGRRKLKRIGTPSLDQGAFWKWAKRAHIGIALGTVSNRVDILFVAILFSARETGLYAAAASLVGIGIFVSSSYGLVISRDLRGMEAAEQAKVIRSGVALVTGCSFGLALPLAIYAGDITVALFGPAYSGSGSIARVLALALPLWALTAFISQLMAPLQLTGQQSRAQLLGLTVMASVALAGGLVGNLYLSALSNLLAYLTIGTKQYRSLTRYFGAHS